MVKHWKMAKNVFWIYFSYDGHHHGLRSMGFKVITIPFKIANKFQISMKNKWVMAKKPKMTWIFKCQYLKYISRYFNEIGGVWKVFNVSFNIIRQNPCRCWFDGFRAIWIFCLFFYFFAVFMTFLIEYNVFIRVSVYVYYI